MATINFKIRPGRKSSSSIYIIMVYGRGNELRYSTGWKVNNSENWNESKQRVKTTLTEPQATKINQSLNSAYNFLMQKFTELKASRVDITNHVLRNELDIYLRRRKTKATPSSYKTLLECYHWYFNYYAQHDLPTTKKPLAEGTVKSYKTGYKVLTEFHETEYALSYERINLDFYASFIDFLNRKGFSKNYISNNIKMLKTIMNYAWEKRFHTNLEFKSRSFAKTTEEVDNIYLSEAELKIIEDLELSGRMENARDLFLIGANTGLRVSDFNRLTEDNIKEADGLKYIEVKVKKTNSIIGIPIKKSVQRILERRNGNPPKRMPEQNINNLLKKIGELANLVETVQIGKTIGGRQVTITKPKYELITNHTARRSFCTNAYLAGMPTLDIMAISGHRTEKSFYKYIKVSNLERIKKIAQHPFFN